MTGGRGYRHAGGGPAAEVQGDGITAAIGGNGGIDRASGGGQGTGDHQRVSRGTGVTKVFHCRDREGIGSRCGWRATENAGIAIDAQACRQTDGITVIVGSTGITLPVFVRYAAAGCHYRHVDRLPKCDGPKVGATRGVERDDDGHRLCGNNEGCQQNEQLP